MSGECHISHKDRAVTMTVYVSARTKMRGSCRGGSLDKEPTRTTRSSICYVCYGVMRAEVLVQEMGILLNI